MFADRPSDAELEYATPDAQEEAIQRKALGIPSIFSSAMNVAKMAAAHTPEVVRQSGPDEEAQPISGHEFERVLQDPNPWMSNTFLFWFTYLCLPIRGNAFWFLADDLQGGPIQEIWPIPPWRVQPVPGANTDEFIRHYNYTTERQAQPIQLPAANVLWARIPNPFDLFDGLSLISPLATNIDTAENQRTYRANFFGEQHARPAAAIGIRKDMSPSQFEIIKEEMLRELYVLNRATMIHRAGDVDVKLLGMTADDLGIIQFDQADAQIFKEVLGWSEALGAKDTTYASARAAEDMIKDYTIWPYMKLLAGDISAQITKPRYGEDIRCRYEDIREGRKDVERADYEVYGNDRTINENRKARGEDEITNGPAAEVCENVPVRLLPYLQAIMPQAQPEAPAETPAVQVGGNGIQPRGEAESVVEALSAESLSDLDKWERKSLRMLREKGAANPEFTTDLPLETQDFVNGALWSCTTPDEVKIVFVEAKAGRVGDKMTDAVFLTDGWIVIDGPNVDISEFPSDTPVEVKANGGSMYITAGELKASKKKAPFHSFEEKRYFRKRRVSVSGDIDPLGQEKDGLETDFELMLLAFWKDQLTRIDGEIRSKAPKHLKSGLWDELPGWIRRGLDAKFWAKEDRELVSVVVAQLTAGIDAVTQYHSGLIDNLLISIGIDWSLINAQTVEWARMHAGKLCRATFLNPSTNKYEFSDQNTINGNTRKAVGTRVAKWFETPGATLGDLMDEISQLRAFGPQAPDVPGQQTRAQLVATTEITRSVAYSNKITADRLTEQLNPMGITAEDKWNTNHDDKVCFICRPLHGKRVPHGKPFGKHPRTKKDIYLPVDDTHPGCFCWITTKYHAS